MGVQAVYGDDKQQLVEAHRTQLLGVQGTESGYQVHLARDLRSMVAAMVASVVFDGLPQWDEEEMFEENSFSEVIWDREASDEPFDERSTPAVIWDEEPIHELHAFE